MCAEASMCAARRAGAISWPGTGANASIASSSSSGCAHHHPGDLGTRDRLGSHKLPAQRLRVLAIASLCRRREQCPQEFLMALEMHADGQRQGWRDHGMSSWAGANGLTQLPCRRSFFQHTASSSTATAAIAHF